MDNPNTSEIFGIKPLPDSIYFSSISEVDQSAPAGQAHYMRRAFRTMELDGILCIDGKPTVYLKDFKHPLKRADVNQFHKQFWNQSTATLLVLQDPRNIYIFSAMVPPEEKTEEPITDHGALVDNLEPVADALEHYKLHERITTGEYYRSYSDKFRPQGTVDRYLIHNLTDLSDSLDHEGTVEYRRIISSFLGRLIFTCYLVDRRIIFLDDYNLIPSQNIGSLLELFELTLASDVRACLTILFTALRGEFNGSMFEENFESELSMLRDDDFKELRKFFKGERISSPQTTLGFWAYDFSVIPVETISAIYESLLGIEDPADKKSKGAFYTPCHLAEMVVDEAVSELSTLLGKRFLDPSCGSGIFLVTLFNRMADEWYNRNKEVDEKTKIRVLSNFLVRNLCGVDVNLTACRITCFSLYVALLDQFEPPYLRELRKHNGEILPKLLAYKEEQWLNIENGSIFEGNFFQPNIPIHGNFDVIIGNPPWPGRTKARPDRILEHWLESKDNNPWLAAPEIPTQKTDRKNMFYPSKQVAHAFMWKAPLHLSKEGRCCMLLPSEVLLNKTDEFQKEWFKRITVDRIIQLADYRHLLFEGAIRPCFIASFRSASPDQIIHEIEYFVPKYLGQDPRVGKIPILPDDYITIPLKKLIESAENNTASVLWKSRYTGSPRDWRLLDYLQQFPPLSKRTGEPDEDKPWIKGKGFKPWYQAAYNRAPKTYGPPKPIPGSLDEPFIEADRHEANIVALSSDFKTLRQKLSEVRYKEDSSLPDLERRASLEGFHRCPERRLFEPPLVLINKGFNRVLFFNSFIFYQDSITGISGPKRDKDYLAFLSVYAQSRLAYYFQYHTAGSLGMERQEVKLHELLRLPFPMPGKTNLAKEKAQHIVKHVASEVVAFKEELAEQHQKRNHEFQLWPQRFNDIRRKKILEFSEKIDQFVYEYFDLTNEEIALIDDTCKIYAKSATPDRPYKPIPTLEKTTPKDRCLYASWLCRILNEWALEAQQRTKTTFLFSAESTVFKKLGQVLVTLHKTEKAREPVDSEHPPQDLDDALQRICKASLREKGSLIFLRGIIFAEGGKIHILKPDMLGKWTRSAGLNDAQELFDEIVSSQRGGAWK
jgi:type I restriction-modification system DNA methylase subunit